MSKRHDITRLIYVPCKGLHKYKAVEYLVTTRVPSKPYLKFIVTMSLDLLVETFDFQLSRPFNQYLFSQPSEALKKIIKYALKTPSAVYKCKTATRLIPAGIKFTSGGRNDNVKKKLQAATLNA